MDEREGGGQRAPWTRCLAAFLFVHPAWKPEVLVPWRVVVTGRDPVSGGTGLTGWEARGER